MPTAAQNLAALDAATTALAAECQVQIDRINLSLPAQARLVLFTSMQSMANATKAIAHDGFDYAKNAHDRLDQRKLLGHEADQT